MPKVLIIIAAVADLAIAALLIGISGFIFGHGPEAGHSAALTKILFVAEIVLCFTGPVAGFMLNARQKAGLGILAAWLPVMLGGLALAFPPP